MTHFLTLAILSLSLLVPIAFFAGRMAKDMGRKFWPWFFIGMVLPLAANFILAFLPSALPQKKVIKEISPVENEHLFDHLFIENINKKRAA